MLLEYIELPHLLIFFERFQCIHWYLFTILPINTCILCLIKPHPCIFFSSFLSFAFNMSGRTIETLLSYHCLTGKPVLSVFIFSFQYLFTPFINEPLMFSFQRYQLHSTPPQYYLSWKPASFFFIETCTTSSSSLSKIFFSIPFLSVDRAHPHHSFNIDSSIIFLMFFLFKIRRLNIRCFKRSAEVFLFHPLHLLSTKHGRSTRNVWNRAEDGQTYP